MPRLVNAQSMPAIPGYTMGQMSLAKASYTLADLESLKKTLLFTDEDVRYLRMSKAILADQTEAIGLHTVFEHHDVMGPQALRVFLDEYRIPFPVGIDQADPGSPVPLTMQAFGLRGTPSVVVFDPQGRVRLSLFGQIDDLQLGAVIGQMMTEAPSNETEDAPASAAGRIGLAACPDGACGVDG